MMRHKVAHAAASTWSYICKDVLSFLRHCLYTSAWHCFNILSVVSCLRVFRIILLYEFIIQLLCNYYYFSLYIFILFYYHADKSRGSKALIRVCLCLSVCLCYRTKTAETTITKLVSRIVSPSRVLDMHAFNIKSKGQRSRSQGHKVQNTLQAIEWLAWVCTLSSGQRLVL